MISQEHSVDYLILSRKRVQNNERPSKAQLLYLDNKTEFTDTIVLLKLLYSRKITHHPMEMIAGLPEGIILTINLKNYPLIQVLHSKTMICQHTVDSA